MSTKNKSAGFTLVELIVAVGLFAIIMTIASGAYLIMINANRTAQGITTGINNLSFALESMTRNIMTGSAYNCVSTTDFDFTDQTDHPLRYRLLNSKIESSTDGGANWTNLTDPTVTISEGKFWCSGTLAGPADGQPQVSIMIAGSVATGPGKWQYFNIETSATMRGTDL